MYNQVNEVDQFDLINLDQFKDLREGSELKNVPESGKSPKGGRSVLEIKKSTIQNVDFLIRGGGPYFHFFPKCICTL